MRDFLDRKILVGDTLVYPHRSRHLMILKKATVTALAVGAIHGINENGRNVIVRTPGRCVSIRPGDLVPTPSGSFRMTYSKE